MNCCNLSSLIVLFFLAGCKVGPKYHKPIVALPDKFAQQRNASSVAKLSSWWTFFQDKYLDALVDQALKNNYELRIAIEKIKETRAMHRIQNAKLFPEIDGTGQALGNKISKKLTQNQAFTSTHLDYFQLGFDALWELDFWGKQQMARDAAYNEYEAQIETMRDIYIILLGDVARTYIEIRALQKKVDLLQQQIKVDTILLKLTNDRLQAGIASEIPDVEQLATLNESKSQLTLLQTSLKQAINRLAVLLGKNPEEFVLQQGRHSVPQSSKPLSVGLPSDLLRRRPDIRKSERLLAAATEQVGQAIADWFPSFSLLGQLSTQATYGSNLFSTGSLSWTIGPSVRLPIITFGRIKFNVEAKKSAQRQALLTYAQSVVEALGDVENWLISFFNEKDRKHLLEEKLAAKTKERNLINSLFQCGLSNQTEYLLAEKNRILAELDLTDVQLSESVSLISVYKSLGGGW